jgi:pyruvate/2-oxoglutarate dehydrogenase complex dihydrolipoamide dehydrogenase (E3) component
MIKLASTATAEARILGHNILGSHQKMHLRNSGIFHRDQRVVHGGSRSNDRAPGSLRGDHSAKIHGSRQASGRTSLGCNYDTQIVASPVDGSILGGEVWGGKSVGEIINIISMAIQKNITVYELVSYQFGTHPLLNTITCCDADFQGCRRYIFTKYFNLTTIRPTFP